MSPSLIAEIGMTEDVFIVRGNGSTHLVGRAGIVEEAPRDLIFPDLFIRVPLDGSKLDSRYFVLACRIRVGH